MPGPRRRPLLRSRVPPRPRRWRKRRRPLGPTAFIFLDRFGGEIVWMGDSREEAVEVLQARVGLRTYVRVRHRSGNREGSSGTTIEANENLPMSEIESILKGHAAEARKAISVSRS